VSFRAGTRGGLLRSPWVQALLCAALLAAVVVAFIGIIPGSGARLDHASGPWLAVGVGLEALSCAGYAALFHGVFARTPRLVSPPPPDPHTAIVPPPDPRTAIVPPPDPRTADGPPSISLARSAEIALGELGAFVVVPTGAGGPAVRVWGLARSGMTLRAIVAGSVIHGVIFNLPYIGAALILGVGAAIGVGPGRAPVLVALAPLGVVIVVLAFAWWAVTFAATNPDLPQGRWWRWGAEALQAIPDGISGLPAALRRPLLGLAAVVYWAGDCAVLVVAFSAVHGSAPVGVIVLGYMLGQLGNALPLPGGVGGVEPVMLGVLTASGVDAGLGAAAIVIYRFISLGLQTVSGTVGVLALARGLRRDAAATDG
jgi:uncharacterized membrane protein YbhN (UPF0104 family)